MADTPTPRSYRIPPISPDSEPPIDRYRQELRDITSLLYEVRTHLRQLRSEVEEIKVIEERASKKKGSIPPISLRTLINQKNATIAVVLALLTALANHLNLRIGEDEEDAVEQPQEESEDGSAR